MSSCENPNVDKDALMTRRQKFDGKTKLCVKCKENTGNIVVRYAVYCKTCFFPLVQGRFRKTLESTINAPNGSRRKGLKASGSLVVGISGGTSSAAMLDLVAKTYFAPLEDNRNEANGKLKGGKEHPRLVDKGVWKGKPTVCYVEVCGAFPGEKDRIDEVRQVVESYSYANFEFVPLRLEDSFDQTWWNTVGGGSLSVAVRSLGLDMADEDLRLTASSSENSPLTAMQTYLSSLPTPTAYHSAIQILIRLLLLHTAASRRASHLLLGTSLTALSINLISGIAQGAGFSVAEEAQEVWQPTSDDTLPVRIVRPMRDIGMKECAIWDWWCNLRVLAHSRTSHTGGKNAISALTKDFIFGLESDYPATVSTIARTCAKLTPKEGSDGICILCGRPAQSGVQEWKSRISIRSYQEASSTVSGNTRPPHLTEDEIKNLTKISLDCGSSSAVPSLTSRLCYACHTLLTSRSSRSTTVSLPLGQSLSSVPLPLWVGSSVAPRSLHEHAEHNLDADVTIGMKLSRSEMKEQIAHFLLPDE